MRPRLGVRTAFVVMLAAGLGIGDDRRGARERDEALDESGFRRISVADCSFERDPDAYLTAFRRHIEGLSTRTERVSRRVQRSEQALGMSEEVPSRGAIDDHIFGKMRDDGVPHAPLATDAEFLRRASLDLTGRIPSADDVRNFLADDNPSKRSDLIKKLTASPEFVDKWTMYYGDLLRNTRQDTFVNRYAEGRNALYKTIKDFVANNTPYDFFVRTLITADGSTWEWGGANYLFGMQTPMGPVQDTYDTFANRTATQFLGLSNLDCILCHDGKGHLDKLNAWAAGTTRKEAWEMSAFFSRYRAPRGPNMSMVTGQNLYYWTVSDSAGGDYTLGTTAGNRTPRSAVNGLNVIKPRYIFETTGTPKGNYREQYAEQLTRDRQFARAAVNYLWKEMMGLGIVEPADQFDLKRLDASSLPDGWTLQPSHPELLEALTDDFIGSGYNVRRFLETIADSSAYQLSSRFVGEWKIEYATYYARKFTRRLWSEEVHDAICTATGIKNTYNVGGPQNPLPAVQWAMQFPEAAPAPDADVEGARNFLNYFMRGNRDQNVRMGEATILQALNMMNHNFVLRRVRNSTAGSTVNRLLADRSLTDEGVVEELYLRTVSRYPTPAEKKAAVAALKANRTQGAENLHWALMNKVDFLYNY